MRTAHVAAVIVGKLYDRSVLPARVQFLVFFKLRNDFRLDFTQCLAAVVLHLLLVIGLFQNMFSYYGMA